MKNQTLSLILCKKSNISIKFIHKNIKKTGIDSVIISDKDTKNTKDIKIFNNQDLIDSNFMDIPHLIHSPSAWDKAFYYIYKNKLNYDYFFLIEEDVFCNDLNKITDFMTHPSLNNIDFVSAKIISKEKCMEWWHWENTKLDYRIEKFFPNKYGSFNPFCRLSKKLIDKIFYMYETFGIFFFQEIMIPTICMHYNLSYLNFLDHPDLKKYFGHFSPHPCSLSILKQDLKNNKIIHPVKLF